MKIIKNPTTYQVTLPIWDFWYLTKTISSDIVYGFNDPTRGLTEEEISRYASIAHTSLQDSGVLKNQDDGEVVDEFIGGMVYACIHSNSMVLQKNVMTKEVISYHFLPNWQMTFVVNQENCILSVYKDRQSIHEYIYSSIATILNSHEFDVKQSFEFGERELEVAADLWESGEIDKAVRLLSHEYVYDESKIKEFLAGFVRPEVVIEFEQYTKMNSVKVIKGQYAIYDLLNVTYWVEKDYAGEEAFPILKFKSVNSDKLKNDLFSVFS